jgi:hypothetical protein
MALPMLNLQVEENKSLGRQRIMWEENIMMDLNEIWREWYGPYSFGSG